MLSEFLFRIFLGVALVVVVFVNLWYLKLSVENLRDGLGGRCEQGGNNQKDSRD